MRKSPWPYVVIALLFWALPAVVIAGYASMAPTHNTGGQCEGIGFGCSLTPHDGAILLGMMAAPVLLVVGLLAMGLVALSRGVRDKRDQP
ncbi:hypothetical protein FB474_2951 [Oryzihumus leptocrescens]|uniref:Uncharacterized protein n=2 Tax=Oryzihumus leptocrescens TaxID=297536 RepID=A0A542ZMW0_9MICO|nr:hypothetical protein FB474_2951 [Oryzihumus leptocrescens]